MENRLKEQEHRQPRRVDRDPAPPQGDSRRGRRPEAARAAPPAHQPGQRLLGVRLRRCRRGKRPVRPTSGCTTMAAWREAPFYTDAERAALALAEGRHPAPGRRGGGRHRRDVGRGQRPFHRGGDRRDQPGDRADQASSTGSTAPSGNRPARPGAESRGSCPTGGPRRTAGSRPGSPRREVGTDPFVVGRTVVLGRTVVFTEVLVLVVVSVLSPAFLARTNSRKVLSSRLATGASR